MKETGQICYEAFMRQLAGSAQNWAEVTSMMPFGGSTWEDLPERFKDAFREAAHQVMQKGWADATKPPRSW